MRYTCRIAPVLGFLASHAASSARAIHHACRTGDLDASMGVLICNNKGAEALAWAGRIGLPSRHLSRRTHPDPAALDGAILDTLVAYGVELVILSGYLKKLGPRTIEQFRNRILNIHPAPLPQFGGQGMYGLRVHEAVLAAGIPTTAITVHLVDEEFDHGPTVHRHLVPVGTPADAVELQQRIADLEPRVFVAALQRLTAEPYTLKRNSSTSPSRTT